MRFNLTIIFFFTCLILNSVDAKTKDNDIYSKQLSKVLEKYQGDEHISIKKFAKKIDDSCKIKHSFSATEKEINERRERCVLSKMTYDFDEMISQMKLREKVYSHSINGINIYFEKMKEIDPKSLDSVTIEEIKLFTKINDEIQDNLTIYYKKNDYDGFYVEYQKYYIDNFIYVLNYGADEYGPLVNFWKKYSINNNGKFKLEDSFECHFDNKLGKNICN